jgi:hypothetical protein
MPMIWTPGTIQETLAFEELGIVLNWGQLLDTAAEFKNVHYGELMRYAISKEPALLHEYVIAQQVAQLGNVDALQWLIGAGVPLHTAVGSHDTGNTRMYLRRRLPTGVPKNKHCL